MTGFYRLVLASYVVVFHLSGLIPFAGTMAVYSFYTLSGYLITLVLNGTYKANVPAFFLNRAIRLYPTYWLCLIVAAGIVWAFPERATETYPSLQMPSGDEIPRNLFVFGILAHRPPEGVTLLPPAWSLNIELVYYLLMGLALSRWRMLTLLWLAGTVILSGSIIFERMDAAYFSFAYPGFAFAVGAATCHYRSDLKLRNRPLAWALFLMGLTAPLIPAAFHHAGDSLFNYIWPMLALHCAPLFAVCAIVGANGIRISGLWKRADAIAGEMSYPMFLTHLPLAVIAGGLLLPTFTLALGFSLAVALLFEPRIQALRRRVRDFAHNPVCKFHTDLRQRTV